MAPSAHGLQQQGGTTPGGQTRASLCSAGPRGSRGPRGRAGRAEGSGVPGSLLSVSISPPLSFRRKQNIRVTGTVCLPEAFAASRHACASPSRVSLPGRLGEVIFTGQAGEAPACRERAVHTAPLPGRGSVPQPWVLVHNLLGPEPRPAPPPSSHDQGLWPPRRPHPGPRSPTLSLQQG